MKNGIAKLKALIPFGKKRNAMVRPADDPFHAMERWADELFDQILEGRWPASWSLWDRAWGDFSPRVNVREDRKHVIVTAEVAGMDEKDLEVIVHDDRVVLRGRREEGHESKDGDWWRREFRSGVFERVIGLPAEVVADKAEAKLRKGVLTIKLPKAGHEEKAKTIRVRVA